MLHLQVTCGVQKSTSGGVLCVFGSHTFVPISRMCKKQTAVSHSSTESATIPLDAGLRMDGTPALQFGELVLETLSSRPPHRNLGRYERDRVIPSHSHSDVSAFESIDNVPPNTPNSSCSTQLYIFEDNAAVIQMTNKGMKPKLEACHKNARRSMWIGCWSE